MDRISMLPECIALKILSNLLDSSEALVRMSVLSKDWFALTASLPILVFREDNIMNVIYRRKKELNRFYTRCSFFKYVAYTTSRFCMQNISAHTVTIATSLLKHVEIDILERCLESALKNGLRVLEINISYAENLNVPMLRLPNILLSASALTSLTIAECELPSSLKVGVLKFKSLKLLTLSRVPIHEGVIEYLTTCCPLLEEIYLRYCYGFTSFCVFRHDTLQKVEIFSKSRLERIDIEAPNLRYFHLVDNKDKAPSMNLACSNLTTFCYQGSPLKRFNDFLSNFPIIENLSLALTSPCKNMNLSIHSLRRLELRSICDLEEIDINTPNLLLFEYCGKVDHSIHTPFICMPLSQSKSCMKWYPNDESVVDTLWFQKLRRFLDRSNVFKVLKLVLKQGSIDVKKLKGIKSPPYELEHVELYVCSIQISPHLPPILDAVLWCCRPRYLTLDLAIYRDKCQVVQNTYETLLQQENKSRTNIRFVLSKSSYSKEKQHFNDLILVLKALSLDQRLNIITFIKEEVVRKRNRAVCGS